jgi:methylthioribose-1-phosphate isomerase
MSTKKPSANILLHGAFENSFLKLLKERKVKEVFVLEARPNIVGAKKLCPQLIKNKITPVLIADNMAGFLFFKGYLKETWISYQDNTEESLACPIGSLILGILAKKHGVAVKAFPMSKKGKAQGSTKSIFCFNGKQIAAKGIKGFVPLVENVAKKYISEIYL